MKKFSKKVSLKGAVTVEMSFVLPVVLMIFMLVIYTVFYYHDKNIIIGAAAETAVVGAQMEREPNGSGRADLNGFFRQRIQGKLILFPTADAAIDVSGGIGGKRVSVSASARRGKMRLSITEEAPVPEPEKQIRRKRIIEGIGQDEE